MANYPSALPLYVQSDHGVGLEMGLYAFELSGNSKVHFTWQPDKELRYKNRVAPRVVRIPHPWVFYRRALAKTRNEKCKGTIVFFTHHVPGVKWEGHDSEEYFAQLRGLPDKYQPVVLCIHMHDVVAGHHKELRRHGLPIITVGNTSATIFVDRFYDTIKEFAYASSPDWGSQVAYCIEFGLPYFFLGKRPRLINIEHPDLNLGVVNYQDELHKDVDRQAGELFRLPVDVITPEQRVFVESMLGLDSKITPNQVSLILWGEFIRHWREWYLLPRPILVDFLRKIGCLEFIKSSLRYLHKGKL
jgi:hypothetical protein